MKTKTRSETVALLERRIDESGLSVGRFAREVLRREERTVFRWLAGGVIPRLVVDTRVVGLEVELATAALSTERSDAR